MLTPVRGLLAAALVVAFVTSPPDDGVFAQSPAPAAASQATGHGLLVGQVVEAGSTRPVAGALVTLGGTPSISSSNVIFSFSQGAIPGGSRLTITDTQGHFVFAELPGGTYSLQATKAGYSPGGYGKRRATGSPQAITLGADERLGDLTIPIWKFASIAGTVLDEAGEPVISLGVRAMRRVYENGRPQFATALAGMAATTDDRGQFRLDNLIPGEYIVGVISTQPSVPIAVADAYRQATQAGTGTEFLREMDAMLMLTGLPNQGMPVGDGLLQLSRLLTPPPPGADGRVFVYPTQFYPSAMSSSQATLIAVRSGEERAGIDLHVKPVATSRVSGMVSSPAGPAANLSLSLVPAVTQLITDRNFETATTYTDARGAFTFLGVPAGQYVLRTLKTPTAPSAASSSLQTVVQTGSSTLYTGSTPDPERPATQIPAAPTLWATVPVVVDRSDVTGLAISLQTGFRVGGHFEFDGVAGRPAADVLRRLVVTFEPVDGRSSSPTVTRGVVDAAGKLSSYELPPGKSFLRVQGTVPGWTFKSAMVGATDVSDTPLDLQAPVVDVVLTFTDHPSALSGTVRTPTGTPDTSAQVLVFPPEAAAAEFVGAPRRLRSARVSRSGGFQITALPPGDYFVIALTDEAAADFPSPVLIRSLTRLASRLKIGDGESKTLDLTTVTIR